MQALSCMHTACFALPNLEILNYGKTWSETMTMFQYLPVNLYKNKQYYVHM